MAAPNPKRHLSAEETSCRWLLELALAGDTVAWHQLLERSQSTMHRRIRRALSGRAQAGQHDYDDILQQTCLLLVRRGPAMLAGWQQERGLSLLGFLGLFAERVARSWLRSGRLSGWAECPVDPEQLEQLYGFTLPTAETRETLKGIWNGLKRHLDDSNLRLFCATTIDEEPVSQICEHFNLTPNAVYCARQRFRKLAHAIVNRRDCPRFPVTYTKQPEERRTWEAMSRASRSRGTTAVPAAPAAIE